MAAPLPAPQEAIWPAILHEPVAFATVLLVLVTAGLWIFTGLLWRATVRLAKEAKLGADLQAEKLERSAAAMEQVAESLNINATQIVRSVDMQRSFGEMQLRAHITVLVGESLYQDEHLRFETRPRLLNTGHTPAGGVRWRIAADVLPIPIPEDYRFSLPTAFAGGSILGPHQDAFMQVIVPHRVDEEVAQRAKRGDGYGFLVWGFVTYQDQFRRTHRCTFAQQISWEACVKPDGSPGERVRVAYLPKHNRTS